MLNLLAVFVGGGLGSLCRYALGFLLPNDNFPMATLAANIFACFILGFLTVFFVKNQLSDQWKLLLGTGFCGGFSTFSTFSKELTVLERSGEQYTALIYLVLSLFLGIIAVYVGMLFANLKN